MHGWQLQPDVIALLTLSGGAYAAGMMRARRWPARRGAAFAAGLLTLAVALLSPVAAEADASLRAHMVQHLLIAMVAAPLLIGGAPVTLALRAARPDARRRLAALLQAPPVRTLVHPIVTWSLLALVVLGTHFTAVYDAAVGNELLHAAQHAAYLWAGLLFWLPVLGAEPQRIRMGWLSITLYLIAAMPVVSTVGVVMLYAQAPLYASYPVLAEQQDAGMLMWLGGTMMLAFAALTIGWAELLREERRQVAREQRLEGLP